MTRRNPKGYRDQDLTLALLRLEAAFGPVQVLEVRPNPRRAEQGLRPDQTREETAQTVMELDGHKEGEGGEAVA